MFAHIALRRHQGACAICAVGEEGARVFPLSTSSTVWRGTVGYAGLQVCPKHNKVSCFVTHETCDESYASLLLLSLSLRHPCHRLATLTSEI